MAPPRILVIAGSDSGGGAGIQADIKTACAFGVYAMTAVTAVTVQDTTGVHAMHAIPPEIVRGQIDCCLSDIGTDAIKIGMLGSRAVVDAVADAIESRARGIPLVLDPVLASTSGTPFLDDEGIDQLLDRLLPRATLVTPNLPELERLARKSGHARDLLDRGAKAVLVKGGHAEGDTVTDVLHAREATSSFEYPRLVTRSVHGTGCTLSTAIACGLARGLPLAEAVKIARDYLQAAIATAPGFGHGHGPLNHLQPR